MFKFFRHNVLVFFAVLLVVTTGCDYETTEIQNQKEEQDQQILESINYLLGTEFPRKQLIIGQVTCSRNRKVESNDDVVIEYKVRGVDPLDYVVFFPYNNGTCFTIADSSLADAEDGAYYIDSETVILQLNEENDYVEGIWYADLKNQYIVKLL